MKQSGVYDVSKVEQMMLKFRPIAPKPTPNFTPPVKYVSTVKLNSTGRVKRRSPPKSTGVVTKIRKKSPVSKTVPFLLPKENSETLLNFVGSWVKVECVLDTWVVDEERVKGLDVDTCPGFMTDGLNRVVWMNEAYRRMVGFEAAVEVVVGEGVTFPVDCAVVTCRVKVVMWGKERVGKTVPCDVWRLEGGKFAWRLDTTAALSLSLGW